MSRKAWMVGVSLIATATTAAADPQPNQWSRRDGIRWAQGLQETLGGEAPDRLRAGAFTPDAEQGPRTGQAVVARGPAVDFDDLHIRRYTFASEDDAFEHGSQMIKDLAEANDPSSDPVTNRHEGETAIVDVRGNEVLVAEGDRLKDPELAAQIRQSAWTNGRPQGEDSAALGIFDPAEADGTRDHAIELNRTEGPAFEVVQASQAELRADPNADVRTNATINDLTEDANGVTMVAQSSDAATLVEADTLAEAQKLDDALATQSDTPALHIGDTEDGTPVFQVIGEADEAPRVGSPESEVRYDAKQHGPLVASANDRSVLPLPSGLSASEQGELEGVWKDQRELAQRELAAQGEQPTEAGAETEIRDEADLAAQQSTRIVDEADLAAPEDTVITEGTLADGREVVSIVRTDAEGNQTSERRVGGAEGEVYDRDAHGPIHSIRAQRGGAAVIQDLMGGRGQQGAPAEAEIVDERDLAADENTVIEEPETGDEAQGTVAQSEADAETDADADADMAQSTIVDSEADDEARLDAQGEPTDMGQSTLAQAEAKTDDAETADADADAETADAETADVDTTAGPDVTSQAGQTETGPTSQSANANQGADLPITAESADKPITPESADVVDAESSEPAQLKIPNPDDFEAPTDPKENARIDAAVADHEAKAAAAAKEREDAIIALLERRAQAEEELARKVEELELKNAALRDQVAAAEAAAAANTGSASSSRPNAFDDYYGRDRDSDDYRDDYRDRDSRYGTYAGRDRDGRPYYRDRDGTYRDGYGNVVDRNGERMRRNSDGTYSDRYGNTVDSSGNRIYRGDDGYYRDGYGNRVGRDGGRLYRDNDGNYRDRWGNLADKIGDGVSNGLNDRVNGGYNSSARDAQLAEIQRLLQEINQLLARQNAANNNALAMNRATILNNTAPAYQPYVNARLDNALVNSGYLRFDPNSLSTRSTTGAGVIGAAPATGGVGANGLPVSSGTTGTPITPVGTPTNPNGTPLNNPNVSPVGTPITPAAGNNGAVVITNSP